MNYCPIYHSLLPLALKCQNQITLAGKASADKMDLVARKPVFGVSDKARLKPVSSATESSQKIVISLVASLDIILSRKGITLGLISLREGPGWSAPLLFANPRRQVFSRRGPNSP